MGSCYASAVVKKAQEYIGYTEKGNNWTVFAQELDSVHYFNGNKQNVAWCGTFCYDMIFKACFGDSSDYDKNDRKWDTLYMTYQPSKDNCACACKYGAQYFRNHKAFYSSPKVGDIAFYGSKGSETHQGIVEKIIDSSHFYAIEGNHGNKVARVRRSVSECSGFGRPRYDKEPAPQPTPPSPTPEKKGYPGPWPKIPSRGYFQRYDKGEEVKKLQALLEWTCPGCLPKYGIDGEIGSETLNATKKAQSIWGTTADGFYGPKSEKCAKAYKK